MEWLRLFQNISWIRPSCSCDGELQEDLRPLHLSTNDVANCIPNFPSDQSICIQLFNANCNTDTTSFPLGWSRLLSWPARPEAERSCKGGALKPSCMCQGMHLSWQMRRVLVCVSRQIQRALLAVWRYVGQGPVEVCFTSVSNRVGGIRKARLSCWKSKWVHERQVPCHGGGNSAAIQASFSNANCITDSWL